MINKLNLNKCCGAPYIETGWNHQLSSYKDRYIECKSCKAIAFGNDDMDVIHRWNISILENGPDFSNVDTKGFYWVSSGDYEELPCMELTSTR